MGKRKLTTSGTGPNDDFIEFLTELADYEKNVTRNIHKYNAYKKAANTLKDQKTRIESGAEAHKLPGIGDKIAKKIDEFLATGKLQKLENIHHDEASLAITEFTKVSGIGPVKAKQLYDSGIKTVRELQKHKDKLTHHQSIGLKYFDDFQTKIPRSEIEQIETILREKIAEIDSDYQITICGSYRRGKPESGDIDVLITHQNLTPENDKEHPELLKQIVNALEACGLITDVISLGKIKFMGVCQLNKEKPMRRIDIKTCIFDQYYFSVLYFTGSDAFNRDMRVHAQEAGFTLNEYSLRPVGTTGVPGEPIRVNSEEEIFDYIDYPYKKPEDR